jgi:acyl-CoA thioester hydrolase
VRLTNTASDLESHIDTFGHVNNAAYLEILEEARWDLITRNGYGLDEVQRRRIGPIVLDVHLRFVRELRNRQAVIIRWMDSYSGKVGRFASSLDDAGAVLRREVHDRPVRPDGAQADPPDTGVGEGTGAAARGSRDRARASPSLARSWDDYRYP